MQIYDPSITGSLNVSGSTVIVGNLTVSGTLSSTAILSGTASFAQTASYVNTLNQSVEITGSLNVTGSQANFVTDYFSISTETGTGQFSSNFGEIIIGDVNGIESIQANSRYLSDGTAVSINWANRQLIKSNGSTVAFDWENGILTSSLHGTASWAENALTASYVENAQTASYVSNAISASYSDTASYVELAQTASYIINAISASYSDTASYVETAQTASYATSAELLDGKDSSIFATTGSNVFVGIQEISGALQLNPAQDPGSANVNSAFLFVSTSADNTEYNLHYRNNGALWETHWLEERVDTGLVWGGVLTFTGTTMSITPGAGLIVNHNATTSSHGDTTPTYVQFGPITASAQFITSSQVTYLLIDSNGSLVQQTSIFTPQQYNEAFPLGYIFCLTTSSISSYADARITTYGQDEQQSQFIRAFGPLKVSGYDITPQSGSLKISIASGRAYRVGGFYSQNPDNPSLYDSTNVATGSLVRVYRDPAVVGGFKATLNGFVPFTDVDPTMWDDGTGTLAAVGASEWTIQRLFQGVVNGITYIYYGQNKYDSLAAAIQSITTEAFEESPTSILALPFIGYIICRGNTTNLSDTTNNKLINSGLFRNTAGSSGGGGVATTNLNDLADVNITSPANGQALVYNLGSWINSNPDTASFALNSGTASFVNTAQTASYVVLAQTASFVDTAQTASYVVLAQTASYVLNAVSSSFATTSSYAATASYALSGNGVFSGSFSGSFQGAFSGNGSALTGISATAAPAGPDKSIQFNDNGTVSGSADLIFHKTTDSLVLIGSMTASAFSNIVKFAGSTGSAGDHVTTQYLTGDVSNSTTTLVPGMTTQNVVAGTYQFKYVVRYQSAATTTGIGLAANHTGTATYWVSSFWFVSTGGAAATGVADQVAAVNAGQMVEGKSERAKGTSTSATAGVDTQNVDMLTVMEGVMAVSTDGTLTLEFKSEVAASAVTLKAGTCLILTKLS